MTPLEATAILLAGFGAGTANAIVGAGSLLTFPTLIALGFPPLTANMTSALGIQPGLWAAIATFRPQLQGRRPLIVRLGAASAIGGAIGSLLLLALPEAAFERIAPILILIACALVAIQPWLSTSLARHRGEAGRIRPLLAAGILATGVYTGYFGAGGAFIYMALLAVFLTDDMHRQVALRSVLAAAANITASILFIAFGHVAWPAVLLLATSSTAGGLFGARIGRRLPATALRWAIIVVGAAVAVRLVLP